MFKLKAGEDTFTPWIDRKQSEMEVVREQILTSLSVLFLERTDPLVPKFTGSLRRSAHYLQTWSHLSTISSLFITWSGAFNPHQEAFDEFYNYYRDDYAMSVYEGHTLYKKGVPEQYCWVTEAFAEDFTQADVEEVLREQLMMWFLK